MSNNNTSKASLNLVKFISWNCKGLNNVVKRGNILSHLKTLEMDVGFLQETHLRDQDHRRLRANWIGQVYHSMFPVKNRGAAILIRKTIPFESSKIISDPRGRYVIVSGKLYNNLVTLASICAQHRR